MSDIKPQFEVMDLGLGEVVITMKGAVTNDAENFIRDNEFDSLVIDPGFFEDLSFLKEHKKKIKNIRIRSSDIDWKIISQLSELRSLSIDTDSVTDIDFTKLKKLAYLELGYWLVGLEDSLKDIESIKALKINFYSLDSLVALGRMRSLEYLLIHNSRKIESLSGVSQFNNLRYLEVSNCSKLADIRDLSECPNIRGLFFSKCKGIVEYKVICEISKLEELTLSCKTDSVSWIEKLKYLKLLRLDCNLDDGSLDFLYKMISLRLVLFNNKKNYSVKIAEIRNHLESKGYDQEEMRLDGLQFPSSWSYQ